MIASFKELLSTFFLEFLDLFLPSVTTYLEPDSLTFLDKEVFTVKIEYLRLLATLRLDPARMQLISGFIDTYLRLSAEEEQQFQIELGRIEPVEREAVMEIVTSWMQQGIEQGLQQGRQEGQLALILRLLNRRLGGVAPEVEERIRSLSIDELEDLGEALLDFSDASDLAAWLDRQTTP